MRAKELIAALQEAQEPNRFIDTQMAVLIGYKKLRETPESRAIWHSPSGHVVNIPHFTRSIQEAKLFADMILPEHAGAVKWTNEPSAQINDSGVCRAATPPIAICVAALIAGLHAKAIR